MNQSLTTLQDNRRQVYLDRFSLGILTMNTQQLFESLNALSLRVKLRSDRLLDVVGDLSRLTDDMKTALRENRQLFLNLLDQESIEDFSRQSVRLGDQDFDFFRLPVPVATVQSFFYAQPSRSSILQ